jgi:hypothetical protein
VSPNSFGNRQPGVSGEQITLQPYRLRTFEPDTAIASCEAALVDQRICPGTGRGLSRVSWDIATPPGRALTHARKRRTARRPSPGYGIPLSNERPARMKITGFFLEVEYPQNAMDLHGGNYRNRNCIRARSMSLVLSCVASEIRSPQP